MKYLNFSKIDFFFFCTSDLFLEFIVKFLLAIIKPCCKRLIFLLSMSKREILLDLLLNSRINESHQHQQQQDIAINTSDVNEIYLNRLQKDIERVKQFNKQADLIINNLNKYQIDCPIEKRLIALNESYEKIPYLTDKNDTIGIVSTINILDDLQQQYQLELNELKLIDSLDLLIKEYKQLLDVINKNKQTKQQIIEQLKDKQHQLGYQSNDNNPTEIASQLNQLIKVKELISLNLKRIIVKYLTISGTSNPLTSIDKQLITQLTIEWSNIIEQLLIKESEWILINNIMNYSQTKFMIDNLITNDVLLIKQINGKTFIKLRGF